MPSTKIEILLLWGLQHNRFSTTALPSSETFCFPLVCQLNCFMSRFILIGRSQVEGSKSHRWSSTCRIKRWNLMLIFKSKSVIMKRTISKPYRWTSLVHASDRCILVASSSVPSSLQYTSFSSRAVCTKGSVSGVGFVWRPRMHNHRKGHDWRRTNPVMPEVLSVAFPRNNGIFNMCTPLGTTLSRELTAAIHWVMGSVVKFCGAPKCKK